MINDNRSDTGYRIITHVVDGKTKECENVCAKKRALNRA